MRSSERDGKETLAWIPIDEAAEGNIRRVRPKTHNILLYLPDISASPALDTHLRCDHGPIFIRRGLLRLDPRGLVVSDGG
jgi:hypothetical protein